MIKHLLILFLLGLWGCQQKIPNNTQINEIEGCPKNSNELTEVKEITLSDTPLMKSGILKAGKDMGYQFGVNRRFVSPSAACG